MMPGLFVKQGRKFLFYFLFYFEPSSAHASLIDTIAL